MTTLLRKQQPNYSFIELNSALDAVPPSDNYILYFNRNSHHGIRESVTVQCQCTAGTSERSQQPLVSWALGCKKLPELGCSCWRTLSLQRQLAQPYQRLTLAFHQKPPEKRVVTCGLSSRVSSIGSFSIPGMAAMEISANRRPKRTTNCSDNSHSRFLLGYTDSQHPESAPPALQAPPPWWILIGQNNCL